MAADLTELEAFAVELAAVAGETILPFFRAAYGVQDKAQAGQAFDPVTDADRAAEAAIRRRIAERFPDHGVIGEEYGEDRPDAEHVWVLDPIDGTRAFIAGLPLWTTLIAVRAEGRPRAGVVAQPYLEEVFVGGPSGARLLRRGASTPLKTRPCPDLTNALLSTTDPNLFQGEEAAAWARLRAACRLTRLGCDAYAYAMLAAGRIDLVCESGLKPWDVEAFIPLIQAAGGAVCDWTGRDLDGAGQVLAVGDPALIAAAAGRLQDAER